MTTREASGATAPPPPGGRAQPPARADPERFLGPPEIARDYTAVMAKRVAKIVGWIVGALVLLWAVLLVAAEAMEVVVLTTYDGGGQAHQTRLWVVDDSGAAWLRCGGPDRGWCTRVRTRPDVELRRGDTTARFQAVIVDNPEARDRIDVLMRDKYGITDTLIGSLEGGFDTVPVRLDPR